MVQALFASGVLLLAALSACEQSKPPADVPKPSNTAQRFVIALTTQPQSTLALVALKQGYFAAEGLEMVPQVHA